MKIKDDGDKNTIRYFEPYITKKDGVMRMGFNIRADWKSDVSNYPENEKDLESHFSWLALVFAQKFLDYSLADIDKRYKYVVNDDSLENESEETQDSSIIH